MGSQLELNKHLRILAEKVSLQTHQLADEISGQTGKIESALEHFRFTC
jgi:hypothetical protein